MLTKNLRGNFHFEKGSTAYAAGMVADPGHDIAHVTLRRPVDLTLGLEWIARYLANLGRPVHSLCAVELRAPAQLSVGGFYEFNKAYLDILSHAGILVDGVSPLSRTTVVPETRSLANPSLYAFSYTTASAEMHSSPCFVVAGISEEVGDNSDPWAVVRPNQVSEDAMREKARHVIKQITAKLADLNLTWDQVTALNIYTVRDIYPLLRDVILSGIGPTSIHGVRWHFARPPILQLEELEIDVRAVRTEHYL
jgi:hypothetical protein